MATSRRALLALILAALAVLPPLAPPDGAQAATPAGLAAASAAGISATGHRLELQLQERSAPAWPGSQSVHWAVTGPDADVAPAEFVSAAPVLANGHAADPHILANQGRAPPHRAV